MLAALALEGSAPTADWWPTPLPKLRGGQAVASSSLDKWRGDGHVKLAAAVTCSIASPLSGPMSVMSLQSAQLLASAAMLALHPARHS